MATIGRVSGVLPNTIPGDYTPVIRKLFQRIRFDCHALDGIVTKLKGGGCIRLRIKMSALLADGDAYRALRSAKAAAGLVPCLRCSNVVSDPKYAELGLVHISEPDPRCS